MSEDKPPAGVQRLIEAKDAEVVIEHHPEDWLAFVIFWSLAFIVFLQFFTRYVLNDSLAWTEEIARSALCCWRSSISSNSALSACSHSSHGRSPNGCISSA